MHHCKVSMDLEFCLSEQQFSLYILVVKLSELFQSKAFVRILRLVLMLVEEILILRLLKRRGEACPCIGGLHLSYDFGPKGLSERLSNASVS